MIESYISPQSTNLFPQPSPRAVDNFNIDYNKDTQVLKSLALASAKRHFSSSRYFVVQVIHLQSRQRIGLHEGDIVKRKKEFSLKNSMDHRHRSKRIDRRRECEYCERDLFISDRVTGDGRGASGEVLQSAMMILQASYRV